MKRKMCKNRYKGTITGFLCLLLIFGLFQRAGAMETGIDVTKADGTLTVRYFYGTDSDAENNVAISGASFHLYRIADVSAGGVYTLETKFEDSGVTNEQLNDLEYAQEISTVIDTLVTFLENELADQEQGEAAATEWECQQAVTDGTGIAVFEGLKVGLYLLVADDLIQEDVLYRCIPSLISIPAADASGTGWEYKVAISAKAEAEAVETEEPSEPITGDAPSEPSEPATGDTPPEPSEPTTGDTPPEPSEPTTGDTPEAPTESTPGSTPEEPTESTPGSTPEKPAEPPTELTEEELPTETVTEPESELPTETVTEPESELPTETVTEPASELPTETATEPESELPTETATEPESELPTETVTESESETAVTESETETESIKATESETTKNTESNTAKTTEAGTESESGTETAVQTGDNTPVGMWMLVLLLSASAMTLLVTGQKRRMKGRRSK